MSLPYFRKWVENWRASPRVSMMTLEQKGAFDDLLCISWQMGPIPDDRKVIQKLLKTDSKTIQRVWTDPLVSCWTKTKNGLINERLETERVWANSKVLKAKRAAKKRWAGNADAHADVLQTDMRMDMQMECHPDPDPDPDKKDLFSSESSKTQTLQRSAGEVGSVPSKRISKPENSKGKSKTLSAGAAAWRGLEVSWEEYCSGISWSEDEAAVKLDGLAGAGLRQHLRRLAQEEELPMLSDTQLQEGWGKMNSNFLADPRKRGKYLPSHVMKWLESDMRRLGSYSKGQGQKPDAFKVALEKALLEEEKDAGK